MPLWICDWCDAETPYAEGEVGVVCSCPHGQEAYDAEVAAIAYFAQKKVTPATIQGRGGPFSMAMVTDILRERYVGAISDILNSENVLLRTMRSR